MEETSLSDFVGSEEASAEPTEGPDTPAAESRVGDDDGDTESADGEESVESPQAPTSEWHPDGITCADCESSVARAWFADGRRICAACKSWE